MKFFRRHAFARISASLASFSYSLAIPSIRCLDFEFASRSAIARAVAARSRQCFGSRKRGSMCPLGRYAGLLPILQHLRYITNFPKPISYSRHPRNQSPSGAQQSPAATSSLPESVTQNSASSTPPTITINGDNPAIITVGDSYADLGATVSDTGPDRREIRTSATKPSSTARSPQTLLSTQAKSPPTPSTTWPPTMPASPQRHHRGSGQHSDRHLHQRPIKPRLFACLFPSIP